MIPVSKFSAMIAAILLLVVTGVGHCQEVTTNLTDKPEEASFVYDDVLNFIRAQEMLADGGDTLVILQAEYIGRGTPGLKMFIEKYGLTPERLAKAIRKYPDQYASLKRMPRQLKSLEGEAREAFVKLKKYIPGAVYPPTYFLVEAHRGIGSGSTEGQLISVDKWKPPLDHQITMIIHELVHFQQVVAVGYDKYKALFGPEKSLLGLCIREGTAEFFADLVTGRITQDEGLEYTLKHEERLWEQFETEMNGEETGDWMWKKPEDPEQPYHVGYAMGYRIVEAYYNNAEDKAGAVNDILSVTDYQGFLDQSGYRDKMSR